MAISSAGLGSGLDVNSIVTQMMALERRPITLLKSEASQLNTKLSAFGRLQGVLSTLRDAAAKLGRDSTWDAMSASSGNTTALGVASSGKPMAGVYSVNVDRLASGQTVASRGFADSAAVVGSGTLRIELGDFDAQPPLPKAGASAVDIIIEPGADSLAAIRDRINAAGAGVQASIVTDLGGARLVLRSSATGLENGFRIEVLADADGNPGDTSGLSALAYDPRVSTDPQAGTSRVQTAANAQLRIDGLALESASNTVDGAIQGVSLTLRQAGVATEVRVEPDTDALKKAVDEFAAAYNETVRLLREQTRYDPATKTAGALQGDRGAVQLLGQLRSMFGDTSGASPVFQRLPDIGLTLNTDGRIVTDNAKLSSALTQRDDLRKLFSNVDAQTPGNEGLGRRFDSWLGNMLGSDGTLENRQQSLKDRVRSNEQQQEKLEARVQRSGARMLAQYTALDTRMGQLQSLSSYVTQQMLMLNNNVSNSR